MGKFALFAINIHSICCHINFCQVNLIFPVNVDIINYKTTDKEKSK